MAHRVLVWGELFWPYVGGAELFAARLMADLAPRGYEFAVVTSHDHLDLPDEEIFRGVPVRRFPFRHALATRRVEDLMEQRQRVVAHLEAWSPQVVLLNGVASSAFFCLPAVRAAGASLLLRLNSQPVRLSGGARPRAGSLIERVLGSTDWVASASADALEQATSILPAVATRSSVVYSGVETPAESPAPPPPGPPRIVCLGRLVDDKGFDLALAAFARIAASRPAARLVLAGDGPARAALERQASALGLAAQVEFRGWVLPGEVAQVLSEASVVLMPSRTEGLPGVALESAACGRAVVASRVGGLPEIVVHGETGLLVDLEPAAIAAALEALLGEPGEAARMGLAAWRRARAVFDRARCLDAYDELLRRLAQERR